MKTKQPKEITAEQFVDHFLKKIGVGGAVKPEQFWINLRKKFGKLADEFGDSIDARAKGKKEDPYASKNRTIEFANAVAAQFDAAKLRSMALWFIRENFQLIDQSVLEVGCDNGILLCMFAELFPDAQFIGIDPCEPAINIARERAKSLGLTNIEFQVASVETIVKAPDRSAFDLIFSVAVFHELLADGLINRAGSIMRDSKSAFSIEEVDKDFTSQGIEVSELRILKDFLSDDGKFISVDRWGTQNELLKWIRLNEKVGLCCSLPSSNMIRYKDSLGKAEVLPLTVFTKELKAPLLACDVLSFQAYPGFINRTAYHLIEDLMVAEMVYGALIKEEIYFQEAIYNDASGTERLTMGVANGLGYVYTTSSTGFRRLALIPSAVLYEKAHEMDEARVHAEKVASVKYHWGDSNLLSRLNIPLN
jgi:SAM-dependent methyltransferase